MPSLQTDKVRVTKYQGPAAEQLWETCSWEKPRAISCFFRYIPRGALFQGILKGAGWKAAYIIIMTENDLTKIVFIRSSKKPAMLLKRPDADSVTAVLRFITQVTRVDPG